MDLTKEKIYQIIQEELDAMREAYRGPAGQPLSRPQRRAARMKRHSHMSAIRHRGTLNNNELMKKHNANPPEGISPYFVDDVLSMFKELVKDRKPTRDHKIPEDSKVMEVVKAWMGNAIGKIVAAAYVGEEEITSPKRQATLESELKNIEEG